MDSVLSPAAQQALLKIARSSVEAASQGKSIELKPPADLPELDQPLGAFVTLHKHGQLRGCIGRFLPNIPVWQVVTEMAQAAATEDTRFQPVSPSELADIHIEISVLSPLVRVKDPLMLKIGVHGIYIKRGWSSGTFLPQVATEYQMTKEQFLSTCCAHKAGLPPDAWKDPATEVYLYTAQIFQEPQGQK